MKPSPVKLGLLLVILLFILPSGVFAQRDTGRGGGKATVLKTGPSNWNFGFNIGVGASGDLFDGRTTDGTPAHWQTPSNTSFYSSNYSVTLDEAVAVSASITRRLGERMSLRADLSWTELDVSALALIGEVVEPFLYDRLSCLQAGLSAEWRLVSAPSYVYGVTGLSLLSTSATADDLSQNRMGWLLGFGYHKQIGSVWGIRAEIMDTLHALDTTAHLDAHDAALDVPIVLTDRSMYHLFQLVVGVRGAL